MRIKNRTNLIISLRLFVNRIIRLYGRLKLSSYLTTLKNVLYFSFLLISFHYIYVWWSGAMSFAPVKQSVDDLFIFSSKILFDNSQWTLRNLGIHFITQDQTFWVYNGEKISGFVEVSPGCTSLKQWMHWIFIMTLFSGPWKHKLWYIPSGIIVIHFINVFRVVGLAVSVKYYPEHFEAFHNYFFKTFFYFIIFLMWVLWTEKFSKIKKT